MRAIRLAAAAALLPCLAAAQSVHYAVTVDTAAQAFRVRADFAVPEGRDTLLLSLPAWTPGSYGIENYARYVRHFEARAGDSTGQALAWDKLDKDTWRIVTGGARAVSVLLVTNPDTFNLTYSRILPDFAFFNGTNLLLYPEGTDFQYPADLDVRAPAGWKIATGLDPAGPGRWHAANYHDLVDAPFFIGHFWMDSVVVDAHPIRFAIYPDSAMTPRVWQSVSAALRGIAATENRLMGVAPYDGYTILFYAPFAPMDWGGGLEHHNSQFDAIDAPDFSNRQGVLGDFTRPLLSHEFFHLWNVKRVRPAAMWPYDYSREQFTPLLWWSEGVTDYFSDVTLARSGLWTVDQFLGSVTSNIMQVEMAKEPTAVEDASIDTWIEPTWVNESQYYYPKGSLLGLMIDIQMRAATNNQHSLDEVMRRLYSDFYQRGRGFTTEDLLGLIRPSFPGIDDFYSRYINGREPLPYARIFRMAGIAVSQRTMMDKRGGRHTLMVASRDPAPAPQAAAILAGITSSR